MVALVRSWQDLAKILASIPMHLGKRAKIRVSSKQNPRPLSSFSRQTITGIGIEENPKMNNPPEKQFSLKFTRTKNLDPEKTSDHQQVRRLLKPSVTRNSANTTISTFFENVLAKKDSAKTLTTIFSSNVVPIAMKAAKIKT